MCLAIVASQIRAGGKSAEPASLNRLIDCAEICQAAASFVLRNSDLYETVCISCAEVCLRCAEYCERIPDNDEIGLCAEMCMRSAESCQRLVGRSTLERSA